MQYVQLIDYIVAALYMVTFGIPQSSIIGVSVVVLGVKDDVDAYLKGKKGTSSEANQCVHYGVTLILV